MAGRGPCQTELQDNSNVRGLCQTQLELQDESNGGGLRGARNPDAPRLLLVPLGALGSRSLTVTDLVLLPSERSAGTRSQPIFSSKSFLFNACSRK